MRRIILALVFVVMAAPFVAAQRSLTANDTVYLRDGRAVRGTVVGFIGGRFAVRVAGSASSTARANTARTGNEEGEIQFFRPRDIDRVELAGRSLAEARFDARTVEVALGPNWVDSGVDLRRGERVQVRASGTILTGRTRITPDGLRATDPSAPLPRASEGVLIGAVGNDPNSPIIEIGSSREFVADSDGRLYLTANRSTYTDARGAFTVQVRTERELTQRRTDVASNRDDDDNNDAFGRGNRRADPAPPRPRTTRGGSGQARSDDPGSRDRTPREVAVTVPGNSRGTDTGVDLRANDQVTITATGTIVAGRRAGQVSPDGGRVGLGAVIGTYPVPNAGVGALIGYIRLADGQNQGPFVVGSQQTFTAPADGRLFLLVNDDNYSDNSGSFSVRIRY